MARRCEKWGFWLWIFAEGPDIGGVSVGLLVSNRASFEGRRDGGEGQGAGVVQIGVDGGGNVGKRGLKPPNLGAPSSRRFYREKGRPPIMGGIRFLRQSREIRTGPGSS